MKGPLCQQPSLIFTAVLVYFFSLSDALRITPPHLRVREGRPATLICWTNDRSIPTGGITWSGPHGRTYGPASGPIGDRVRAANHFLYITNANRSDHGSYRCTSVATGTQSPATVVEVTKPPTIRNQMPIQPIHLHQTNLIRCDVDLGYPTSTVIWYKNHIRIIPNARITITGSGLQIQNVHQSDEGLYECYAYNSEGVASLNITVTFRAPPQFLQNNNNTAVEIRQGGPIELDCSAVGAPEPNYTWTTPPGSNRFQGPALTGPILRIPFTNARDMGMYRCNASNELGAVQRTFNVNVYVPPTPTLAHHNHTVSLSHSVTLNCSVQAQPSPTYTWFHYDKQSRREFPITDSRYTKLQNGSLHISNVQLSDFNQMDCIMLLLCSADNTFGVSKQYYTITLQENECVVSTDIPTNSPSTQPTSISTSSSGSRSTDSRGSNLGDPAPTDLGQQPFLIPLIATFAAILFLLFLVVVAVVVYLVIICRHKRKPPKPSIETGNRHTTVVTPHNSRLPSTTTLINSVSVEPPPLPFPHNNGTTQSYLHPRGSIDSVDSGVYSKLNHHLPNRQHRLESTSSANSNAPLLASCSSMEEDSPLSPGYSHIAPPANQEGSQTSRCGNCNRPIDTSPHVLNQMHCPIDTSPHVLNQMHCPIDTSPHVLNQMHRPIDTSPHVLNQTHHPIDTSQPNQTPAYLQLRGETRNPPAVYETVS